MTRSDASHTRLRFDYTAVGHVTVDVLGDGTRRPGGSALYAALQAARLGLRARIVTSGVVAEIERLLDPYRDEVALEIRPAAETTTLTASGWGSARTQRVLAWAGPIPDPLPLDTAILHLAPVAREVAVDAPTPMSGAGPASPPASFVGLTPQGLARAWDGPGGAIALTRPDAAALALARACHAVVVNEHERDACEELIGAAAGAGALTAVTAGSRPVTVLHGGRRSAIPIAPSRDAVDDLGAGDVFAAALFIGLSAGRPAADAVALASAAAAVRMAGHGPGAIGDASAIEARAARASGPGPAEPSP